MKPQKLSRFVWVGALSLMAGFVFADEQTVAESEQNRSAEVMAKTTAQRTSVLSKKASSQVVHPAGTQFYITEIHPSSTAKLSNYQGIVLTATACKDNVTDPGINLLTYGDRQGWYDGCFTKAGSTFEDYLWGFKFSLVAPHNPTNASYSSKTGLLTLPSVSVDGVAYSAVLIHEGNNRFRVQNATKK